MNNLKYRAWTGQEMLEVGELTFFMEGYYLVNDEFPISANHLIQSTGLFDKNGVEIFAGDIVKGGVYYGWKDEEGLGVVKFGEWEQDASGHEYSPETCLGWFIEVKESDFFPNEDSHLFKEKAKEIEIIGNIYSNPELLNNE